MLLGSLIFFAAIVLTFNIHNTIEEQLIWTFGFSVAKTSLLKCLRLIILCVALSESTYCSISFYFYIYSLQALFSFRDTFSLFIHFKIYYMNKFRKNQFEFGAFGFDCHKAIWQNVTFCAEKCCQSQLLQIQRINKRMWISEFAVTALMWYKLIYCRVIKKSWLLNWIPNSSDKV